MGTLRCAELQTRATEVNDLTRLTVEEVRRLVPPVERTFHAHMAAWRLAGRPRTARRYTTDQHCPLPCPAERLLFILSYLQTYPLHVGQGRLLGMGQSNAHQWMPVLWVVLRATLQAWGDAPTRSLTALAKRLEATEADVSTRGVPPPGLPPPAARPATAPAPALASPLLGTMAPHGASRAPKIHLSKRAVIAARTSATR
jgi:hypothetical protein